MSHESEQTPTIDVIPTTIASLQQSRLFMKVQNLSKARDSVALFFFFFQAEDGIRDLTVTGVQTCALPIYPAWTWVLPDPRRRAALLPWLFRLGFEVTDADVWTTREPVLGAARWLPPGRDRKSVV